MLRTLADLLAAFADEERNVLAKVQITHGPTIGEMYEGLTKEILSRALPVGLGLQVVSGFIYDDSGARSGQIDCMLVAGDGLQIPYTPEYQWHIRKVIVILEVKKAVFSKDLADGFEHIRGVLVL